MCEPVPTRIQGRCPDGGCEEVMPPAHKKIEKKIVKEKSLKKNDEILKKISLKTDEEKMLKFFFYDFRKKF